MSREPNGAAINTNSSLKARLFRVQPVDQAADFAENPDGLKRSITFLGLLMLSVGSIVGTGIFVILGEAVPIAGPAVVLSFVLAGITCAFSALSYAELASTIPVSGSSYSYTYATMGELIAWVCGWCLMLMYGVSVAAVAVGWSQYITEFLHLIGIDLTGPLMNAPDAGGVINLPAIIVVGLALILLSRGASESTKINTVLVFVKIAILLMFCIIAFTAFNAGNFEPFMPMGIAGLTGAAGLVFFSFIGFDTAATAGAEAKNPKRDLPRAIIAALIVVTLLYVLVVVAALGAQPWQAFEGSGGEAALSKILADIVPSKWPSILLSVGAVVSIFSVVLAVMYGQTRILFSMSKDGLLPSVFQKVTPKRQIPLWNTIIVAVAIMLLAGFFPIGPLASATSIGTLFVFGLVNVGVIVLRKKRPDLNRGFTVPGFPVVPALGILTCAILFFRMDVQTWIVFVIWMIIGFVVYFSYGYRRSKLANAPLTLTPTEAGKKLGPKE